MEFSQLFPVKDIYLLMWGWIFGGLFVCGVLLYLLSIGTAIHRSPPPVKENSLSIRLSLRTSSEGPTVSSHRHLSNIQSPRAASARRGGGRTPAEVDFGNIRPLSRSAPDFETGG